MAAGSFVAFTAGVSGMLTGAIDLDTDTFVMALLTSAWTPAPDADDTWSDISANEVSTGGGYTAGGVVLTGVAVTQVGSAIKFTSNPATWASFTATFKYCVIVKRAGGALAGTDRLLCYVDANSGGGSLTGGGGTLTVTPNASGIFTATHSP